MATPPHFWLLGVFCTVMGALMLVWRGGPNAWIGVRLPWTYADREIWDKSWLVTAWLVLAMGIGALVSLPAFFVATALMIVVGMAYPWRLYRQKYGTSKTWRDQGWIAYRPVAKCSHCGHLQNLASDRDLLLVNCQACGLPLRSP